MSPSIETENEKPKQCGTITIMAQNINRLNYLNEIKNQAIFMANNNLKFE